MRFLFPSVNATVRYGQEIFVMSLAEPLAPAASKRDCRREAILDVAREVFLAEGYAAASMSTIAAKLGGSKGTLYNYFSSKEELFSAIVSRHCIWQREAMFSILVDGLDIETALKAVGSNYLRLVLSDFSLSMFRLVVAESARDPQIGKIFYESGPVPGVARLAGYLEEAAERGELNIDDPTTAAHMLIGLCQNRLMKIRLCNYAPEPSKKVIETEVANAVAVFLRAYGA
jgi:AcrR family transcriptional regulator